MLEVHKPAFEHRVEACRQIFQTLPTTPTRQCLYFVAKRLLAFAPDQPLPRLKPVAKEVKPLPLFLAVAHMRFIRMERQFMGLHPFSDAPQRSLRFFLTLT
jgi:hypothetical protein